MWLSSRVLMLRGPGRAQEESGKERLASRGHLACRSSRSQRPLSFILTGNRWIQDVHLHFSSLTNPFLIDSHVSIWRVIMNGHNNALPPPSSANYSVAVRPFSISPVSVDLIYPGRFIIYLSLGACLYCIKIKHYSKCMLKLKRLP